MKSSGPPGTFIFSLDLELSWGTAHHRGYQRWEPQYARTRQVVRGLLDLFERYDVRATWAVVGHLFLSSCQPEHGRKHPEVLRPSYRWFSGDWFDGDPCTDVSTDPFWYAPDIVEQIIACPVPQEVGSHGFSHAIVGDPGCSMECFASELEACQAVASPMGIRLKSFVFPRNAVGHVEALAEREFTAFRGTTPEWYARLPGPLERVARMVQAFLPMAAPPAVPHLEQGVWNIPASYFYLHRDGWGRLVPIAVRVRKAVASLRRAARDGSAFHLWTHPFNIASDPQALLGGLDTILREAKSLRDAGQLVNHTMGSMADALLERDRVGR